MNTTENKDETLDLGSMMDETMDDVVAAPDYMNPPNGAYRLVVKDAIIDSREKVSDDGEKTKVQFFKLTYAVVETKELADSSVPPVADGTLFSENFQGTKQGVGFFKARAIKVLNADITGVSYADILANLKGTEFEAVLTEKKSFGKGANAGKEYTNLNIRVVTPD